jgi:hypothetical protein
MTGAADSSKRSKVVLREQWVASTIMPAWFISFTTAFPNAVSPIEGSP